MTVHAVISLAWAASEIPVAIHATVGASAIVTKLRTVTLAAKLHYVGIGDGRAVSFAKRIVVGGVVTRKAGEIAVFIGETLVKLGELSGGVALNIRRARGVAGGARNGDRFAGAIERVSQYSRRGGTGLDRHGMANDRDGRSILQSSSGGRGIGWRRGVQQPHTGCGTGE